MKIQKILYCQKTIRVYNNTNDMFTDIYWITFTDEENNIYQGIVNIDSIILNADACFIFEDQQSKISDFSFWKMEIINGKSQLIRVVISEENLNIIFGMKNRKVV